jgi:hypothetical protein
LLNLLLEVLDQTPQTLNLRPLIVDAAAEKAILAEKRLIRRVSRTISL